MPISQRLLGSIFDDRDDILALVFAAGEASMMRGFGFTAVRAERNLGFRDAIVDGTTHSGTGMGNTFLRNCHFKSPQRK